LNKALRYEGMWRYVLVSEDAQFLSLATSVALLRRMCL
jgi:hypothetical protein